jgi:hypothetical protein
MKGQDYSLNCREEVFSETRLSTLPIMGDRAALS